MRYLVAFVKGLVFLCSGVLLLMLMACAAGVALVMELGDSSLREEGRAK